MSCLLLFHCLQNLSNGKADVNHFQAAGGVAFLIRNLLEAGLLHNDVTTVAGKGLQHYTKEPKLIDGKLTWVDGVVQSLDDKVLRSIDAPFQPDGGLRLMQGRLGRGVIKISAVAPEHRKVKAPAIVLTRKKRYRQRLIVVNYTETLLRLFVSKVRVLMVCLSCTA